MQKWYFIYKKIISQTHAQLKHNDVISVCITFKKELPFYGLAFKLKWIQLIRIVISIFFQNGNNLHEGPMYLGDFGMPYDRNYQKNKLQHNK